MFYWIYDLTTVQLLVLFCSLFVGSYWLGALLVRPLLLVLVRGQADVNNLVGYLLGSHGVIYGILLGLLAVAAFQNYADSDAIVATEAARLAALYRDVSAYPHPHRDALQGKLREYTEFLMGDGWAQQRKGQVPTKGTRIITEFQVELTRFEPQTKGQELLHAEALRAFNLLVETRQQRLNAVTGGIPALLWYVVVLGSVITLVLVWLLDMRPWTSFALGGVLTLFLATVIALIAAMDNPFRGEVSVSPEPFERIHATIMTGEAGAALRDESP